MCVCVCVCVCVSSLRVVKQAFSEIVSSNVCVQINNPDMRVVIMKEFVKTHFPSTPLLDYAIEVEKITTSKVRVSLEQLKLSTPHAGYSVCIYSLLLNPVHNTMQHVNAADARVESKFIPMYMDLFCALLSMFGVVL